MAGQGNEFRVGDRDRDRAVALLGEHFSAGRLEVDEFDERCGRAARARYRSEIAALFADLPEPYPEVLASPAPTGSSESGRPARRRVGAGVVAGSVLLVMLALLWFTKQVWIVLPLVGFWFFWFATRE
ncbi:DUF1707 SHOCT-like domain-containing protein [Actinopolyspora mortivallis]|uniref:DUF1707 domain-containing protein n=1 Tax=Actinopolyspora mortivallis TaxID=33906 RepID=A0A2T0GTL9_ACTMO|nr:DUF1707 domain-containing protein [Actinopolyspora mortivallis]PRW62440.1 hypothetical protein CEP50_15490 [Actinopolyspora mortivallis]